MIQLTLIVIAIFAFIYYNFIRRLRYWKNRNVTQGSLLFILKQNYKIFSKKVSLVDANVASYNLSPDARYVGVYQFLKPVLMIKDPELIKDITVKNFEHFMDHTNIIASENRDPLWTRNLVALRGQKWKDMRSILSPSFTSSKMRVMFSLMSECADYFTNHFLEKDADIVEVEMKEIFSRFTNDIIATTAFGIKVDSLQEKNNEFYMMGRKFSTFGGFNRTIRMIFIVFMPKIAAILGIPIIEKSVADFFIELVNSTIKIREEEGIVRSDMIHLLMEARKGNQTKEETSSIDEGFATAKESDYKTADKVPFKMTNLDIAAQATIFFIAGFETVSTSMCFMAYELAVNQDYQQMLRDEINKTDENCEGKLTYEALLKMKYMDMVLSEALRKWPPAIVTDRQCTKPFTIEAKYPHEDPLEVKKGTTLWFPTYAIHHDPKNHPDPEKFDPERFSDDNKGNINPYAYFPFGLGPRNCIGSRFALLEIKVVFFYLLKKFEIVPISKSEIPLEIAKGVFNFTSKNGFWFGLKRIKH